MLRYDYYRDRDTAFEGFTSKSYTFREEFTSRVWATRYDFPAIKDGRVKRESIPDERPSGMQAWMINTRRPLFQDVRVRQALSYAFDFEWANKNLMFDAYARTQSCFQNSEMMAKGKPSREELALLEPFKDKLPPEVFGEAWSSPVSDGSGQDRRQLRRSAELLNTAGWTVKDGKRVNAKGEPLALEFLAFERVSEPHHALYIKNLAALGIDATMRVVDPVQYRSRMQEFDFDIAMNRISLPLTPGDALRAYFSSKSAEGKGSPNFSGIANPVVDALIDKAIAANDRQSLYTRLPGARSRAARRALLGRRLVQAVALDRLLGHVRPAERPSRTTHAASRRPGGSMPTRRRSSAANRPPTAAAAWRGGRARRAGSRSATQSARHPRDTRLSQAPTPTLILSSVAGLSAGLRVHRLRNGKRLAALGRGLAQVIRHIDRLADRHQRRRLRRADLADRGVAAVDADGDLQPVVGLAPEPVVEVGDHALDRARCPQRRLRGVGAAFVAEQRADAVELHIAERAAGGADRVADALDIERQHIQQVLRQVIGRKVGAVAEVAEQHDDLTLAAALRRRRPIDRPRRSHQRHHRNIALRAQLARQPHVRRRADALQRPLLVVGRRRTELLRPPSPAPGKSSIAPGRRTSRRAADESCGSPPAPTIPGAPARSGRDTTPRRDACGAARSGCGFRAL